MALSEKYHHASFREVAFFIRSETTAGGKKHVVHEYPNSKRRFIEELGAKPLVFRIRGFVHGDEALKKQANLTQVFREEGLGGLVHPLYGRVKVKAVDWEFSSEETNLGEISFTVTFYESEINISLEPSFAGASLVTNAANSARSLGYAAIQATMFINKAQEAIKTTQLIAGTIMDVASGKIKSLSDLDPAALSAFDRVLGTSTRELFQAAVSAEALANTFESFYESMRSVTDPASQRSVWKDLTEYESDREPGPDNTTIRVANENNADVLNGHTRINGLINLFESTAYATFETESELLAARLLLDEKFNTLLGDEKNNPLAGEGDLRTAIQDLRTVTNDTLDELSENTFNIISITPGETSLSLLSYFYYGSLDNEDILRQLNPAVNTADITIDDDIEALA